MISQSNNNNNIYNSNRNRNNGSSNNNNNNDDDSEEGDDEPIIKESIYRTTTVDVNGKDTSDIYTAENDDYLDNNYVYNDDNDNDDDNDNENNDDNDNDNNDDNDNENNDDTDNDDNNNDIMNNSNNNNNIFNNNDNDRISNNLSINQKKLQKRKGTFDNFKEMKYKVILPNSYGQFDTNKVTIENPMDRLLKTKQAQLFLKHYKIK